MDIFINAIHTHQFAVLAILLLALVAVYFLIKNLIKLALTTILILIAVGMYFFLTAPQKSPADLVRAWKKVKGETETVVRTGQEVVKKGKKITQDVMGVFKKEEEKRETKKD